MKKKQKTKITREQKINKGLPVGTSSYARKVIEDRQMYGGCRVFFRKYALANAGTYEIQNCLDRLRHQNINAN